MDLADRRRGALKYFIAALAVCTWGTVSTVLATKPSARSIAHVVGAREPASSDTATEPVRMDQVRLKCWSEPPQTLMGTGARWVRITGATCDRELGVEEITLKNITNGFKATLFALTGQVLTTDFIPLDLGANVLVVQITDAASGTMREAHITITR